LPLLAHPHLRRILFTAQLFTLFLTEFLIKVNISKRPMTMMIVRMLVPFRFLVRTSHAISWTFSLLPLPIHPLTHIPVL